MEAVRPAEEGRAMSQHRKSLGLLAVAGVVGLVAASCGGSSGSPTDAGTADIAHKGMEVIVSDGGDDGSDSSLGTYDGTVGQPCKVDADCASAGGPGVNKCSNSLGGTLGGVTVTLFPTPVCVLPTCNPAPDSDPTGMFLHFCDGPDDPSSPGLCVPNASGTGICLPSCTFNFDGSAPTGCMGADRCSPFAQNQDVNTGAVTGGLGFCQSACETNADCSGLGTGWSCQTDLGFCTQHLKARTKMPGDACTSGTSACNCLSDPTTNTGFCTTACVVGSSTPECPSGWGCENNETNVLMDGTPVTVENVNTSGACYPLCTLGDGGGPVPEASTPVVVDASGDAPDEAGEAGDAADTGTTVPTPDGGAATVATCPAGSVCQVQTPLGPECTP
jgi:hypothetical protein